MEAALIQKLYIDTVVVGGRYAFKRYKIVDGIGQVYYTASPVEHGGTRIADKFEDLLPQLEAEVPILNDFLSKVR